MKKGIKIILAAVAILLVVAVAGGVGLFLMFQKELRAISTIQKLNSENLYAMEYEGDYGLDDLLEAGGAASSSELAAFISRRISKGFYTLDAEFTEADFGCSTIAAKNAAGEPMFGRNFDWEDCVAMVVTAMPKDGYKSISTVNLDFLGYNKDNLPEGTMNSMLALGAPFAPLDGINEAGLCIADLMVNNMDATAQDSGKPDITTTVAIRLILDKAATVDEAVALLQQYDMHSDIGVMHHMAIADTSGRRVVVEYLNNEMIVTETNIVTNFALADNDHPEKRTKNSVERFSILQGIYDVNGGVLEAAEIKDALLAVSQTTGGFEPDWSTPWSIVCNQAKLEMTLYHRENYDKGYVFTLAGK